MSFLFYLEVINLILQKPYNSNFLVYQDLTQFWLKFHQEGLINVLRATGRVDGFLTFVKNGTVNLNPIISGLWAETQSKETVSAFQYHGHWRKVSPWEINQPRSPKIGSPLEVKKYHIMKRVVQCIFSRLFQHFSRSLISKNSRSR